jgi:peptidylprolyl isomerase
VVASVTDYFGFGPTIVSLSYVDTKIGTGPPAAAHKWYTVKYTGYLVDGTVFDSSDNHPDHAPFILQQGTHGVIPGWDTGFYGMRVGGKRRLFIPYQLGYGPSNYPPAPRPTTIPGKSMLIFDIELLAQSDTSTAPKAPPTPPTPPPAATAPAPSTPAAPTPATGSTIVAGHPVGSSQPTQPATPATPQPAIPPASTSPAPPATSATPSPKPQ